MGDPLEHVLMVFNPSACHMSLSFAFSSKLTYGGRGEKNANNVFVLVLEVGGGRVRWLGSREDFVYIAEATSLRRHR